MDLRVNDQVKTVADLTIGTWPREVPAGTLGVVLDTQYSRALVRFMLERYPEDWVPKDVLLPVS